MALPAIDKIVDIPGTNVTEGGVVVAIVFPILFQSLSKDIYAHMQLHGVTMATLPHSRANSSGEA